MQLREEDEDRGQADLRGGPEGEDGRDCRRRTLARRTKKEDRNTEKKENTLRFLLFLFPLFLKTVPARPDVNLIRAGLVGERGVVAYTSVLRGVYADYALAHSLHKFTESYHFSSI